MADNDEIVFDRGDEFTADRPQEAQKRQPGNVSFDSTKYLQEQWKTRYKPFFESLVRQVLMVKQEQRAISFANNYSINLHSHNHPVPIPLGPYITAIEWSNTLDDPFNQCNINLAMPIADASIIFTDDHGKMSPGQYVFFSKAPAVIGKPVVSNDKQNYAAAQGCFLGYITDITWSMATNGEGNIIQNISLEINSFIHALQMGQYYISPVEVHDQNTPQVYPGVDVEELKQHINTIENAGGSAPFAMKMSDWQKIIQIINGVASGQTPSETQTVLDIGGSQDEDGNYLYSYEENVFAAALSKVGLRADLSGSMYYLLKLLGYPLLPGTLKFEPFDINTWISLFYTHDMMDTESILLLYKQALSDEEFKRKAQYLAAFFRHVGRGASIYSGTELDEVATFLYDDIEDSVRFEDAVRTGNMNLAPTRIGDVIRIATSKYDLPPSCGLRNTLPEQPIDVNSLTAVQSINKVSTTIWSLFEGTFDFDEEMYELFPVLIPIEQSDVVNELKFGHGLPTIDAQRWDLRDFLHPLHRNMRCIPYIIYRQKPMFPGVVISSAEMTRKAEEFNHNNIVNKPYRPLTYRTYSERVGRNNEGEAYHLVNAFQKDYGTFFEQNEIISLTCQYSDLKRLNGVRIKSPFEGQNTDIAGTTSLADPIIDAYDAQRNGLRMYKGMYPLADLDQLITRDTIGAYAERFFITNGYENNMPGGVVRLRYNGHQKILPGTWIALNVSGEEYPAGGNLSVDRRGMPMDPTSYDQMITRLRNMFVVYATTVSHSHDVDSLGNLLSETVVQFERGCFGYQHNILPFFRAASNDPDLFLPTGRREPPDLAYVPDAERLIETLRQRRRGDASQASGPTGQNATSVDNETVGGQDIFENEFDTARREAILRAVGSGQMSFITANALLSDQEKDYDEQDYLQQLVDSGVITSDEALLAQRKEERLATALVMLQGGWITEEFYLILQATIGAQGVEDGNPIPRALRKAFNKQQRAQAHVIDRFTLEASDPDVREIQEAPLAPQDWDPTVWTEVDARFRGEVIR